MSDHPTLFTGIDLIELTETDSTNDYASALLSGKKVMEGTAIQTAFQTQGKGSGNTQWESDAGKNLLLSIIYYPIFLEPRLSFMLNQFVSLAITDTLSNLIPQKVFRIKWPNDVFAGNKKIAGILIQNVVKGNAIQHSIIGIGLNVNQKKFSPALKHATSMINYSRKVFELDEVRQHLFKMLEVRYLQLKQNRIATIQKDYMKNLFKVEEECLFKAKGKRFNAKIVGITGEGKLILNTGNKHEVFDFKEVEIILI